MARKEDDDADEGTAIANPDHPASGSLLAPSAWGRPGGGDLVERANGQQLSPRGRTHASLRWTRPPMASPQPPTKPTTTARSTTRTSMIVPTTKAQP